MSPLRLEPNPQMSPKTPRMNRAQILCLLAGVLLCIFWADWVTPRLCSAGKQWMVVNDRVVVAWAAGWVLIMGATLLAIRLLRRK
jgi:hypothetical protein